MARPMPAFDATDEDIFYRRLLIVGKDKRVRFLDVDPGLANAEYKKAVAAACAVLESGGGTYLDEEGDTVHGRAYRRFCERHGSGVR